VNLLPANIELSSKVSAVWRSWVWKSWVLKGLRLSLVQAKAARQRTCLVLHLSPCHLPTSNLPQSPTRPHPQQVFHGQVWLCFDEKGAATISGVEDTLLEGVLRTWPVLRVRPLL